MPDGRKLPAQSDYESGAKTVKYNLRRVKAQATRLRLTFTVVSGIVIYSTFFQPEISSRLAMKSCCVGVRGASGENQRLAELERGRRGMGKWQTTSL